ncbi:hypothetical protein QJS10_CPB15g01188 [Acorus calamus]|uniref:RNase H type-1 domain-containing protein n=1 Tax=Acorus calamus TaxID=4465 RepID=A0AAV9D561_ACOCL|nr:hypothetical protein QJS10_CPB15g01188 [Acorus calamus]
MKTQPPLPLHRRRRLSRRLHCHCRSSSTTPPPLTYPQPLLPLPPPQMTKPDEHNRTFVYWLREKSHATIKCEERWKQLWRIPVPSKVKIGDAKSTVLKALALFKECIQWRLKNESIEVKGCLIQPHIEELIRTRSLTNHMEQQQYNHVIITDGSVCPLTRAAGAAFVIIGQSYRVLGVGYASWPWSSPIRMEAEAIRLGVQFARMKGLQKLVVVNLLQGLMVGPLALQQTVELIQACDSSSDRITFCKIPRPAEALVQDARRTEKHGVSEEEPMEDLVAARMSATLLPSLNM